MFRLKLFGGAALEDRDGPLGGPPAQRHRLALLALLAAARGRPVSRDKLLGHLWPESDPEKGRRLLTVSVHALRKALGEGALLSRGDDLVLGAGGVRADVAEFEEALERGDREAAVALYAGPFLDGFHLADALEFTHWAEAERDRLSRLHQEALEELAEAAERGGDSRAAVKWWRRLAACEPLRARVALRLMSALDAAGDRAGAIRHAHVYAELFREEIGGEPDAGVLALAERLRREPAAREWTPPPAAEPAPAAPPVPTAPATAEVRAVAVLPFADHSRDRDHEYFSDGLAEEIINALSRVEGMRVIARTSSFVFKGTHAGAREIGEQLGVEYLLEGSVRRHGDDLRITVRLVRASSGHALWSGEYDGNAGEVFVLQDRIARAVVRSLRVELVGGDRGELVSTPTRNVEAYSLYLRGRHAWYRRTPAGFAEAIDHFREAIRLDPHYALAYTGLADVYNMLGAFDYSVLPPDQAFPEARESAERALRLDPQLAEAHAALANTLVSHEWDWEGALEEFRRATALNPGYAPAYHWYSLYLVARGRPEEALAAIRRARELDPVSLVMSTAVARHLYYTRQYERSVEEYRRALEVDAGFVPARLGAAVACVLAGRLEEGLAECLAARELVGERPIVLGLLGYTRARLGQRDEAAEVLARLEREAEEGEAYVPPEAVTLIRLGLGDAEGAHQWLLRAFRSRSGSMVYLRVEPLLDPLRADPRFEALVRAVERGGR